MAPTAASRPDSTRSIESIQAAFAERDYVAERSLATAVFLALSLKRPLLLEGEAGVGKTELAKVIATITGAELIRLQCYEGIDAAQAVYDWDYSRQLLHLRAAEATGESRTKDTTALESELYNERFLIKRALLRALDARATPPVLLIDEIELEHAPSLAAVSDWKKLLVSERQWLIGAELGDLLAKRLFERSATMNRLTSALQGAPLDT